MKHKLIVSLIVFLLIMITYTPNGRAEFAEIEWEQQGYIKYSYGRSWIYGNKPGYTSGFNLLNGFNQDYSLNLGGKIMSISHELSYNFAKDPGTPMDLQLNWDSPWFVAQYDKNIKLSFPELSLAFNKTRIDGFALRATTQNLTVFRGQESYIPLTRNFTVYNAAMTEFALYEIPSAGDILDYSEVIMLNGEVLTRMRDYSINYLACKLQLYVPLEPGMVIEAKYLFIVTNEELAPKGEVLQGAVYTKRWLENSLSGFYFKRGKNENQVLGMGGQFADGPLRVQGEVAVSKSGENIQDEAYDVTSTYTDEKLDLTYQVRNIGADFHEIGVNQYTKGSSQEFDAKYKVEENMDLQVEIFRYHLDQGQDVSTTLNKKGLIDYKFNKTQSLQMIFQSKDRTLNEERREDEDLSLGYTYKSRPLTISIGQSLQSADKRFAKLQVNIDKLRMIANYDVESRWDGKEHKVNVDLTFRPIDKIDISNYMEYNHAFGAEKGNLRLYLNGNWNPTQAWSTNGGYMYFNNVKYDSEHQRYNCMVNYSTQAVNSNINTIAQFMETRNVKSRDLDINWASGVNLPFNTLLNYSLIQKNFLEFNKSMNEVNQEKSEHRQNIGLSYVFNDYYIFSTTFGYSNNSFSTGGYTSSEKGYTYTLGFNYQPDLARQILFNTSYDQKSRLRDLQFDSRISHPIGQFNVDFTGKLLYSLEKERVSKFNAKLDLTLPKIFRVTPKLVVNSEYLHEGIQQQRKDNYAAVFKYQFTDQQYIFLEAKEDRLINWWNPAEGYQAYGIYSGVEITY